jgi:hypothetical protein
VSAERTSLIAIARSVQGRASMRIELRCADVAVARAWIDSQGTAVRMNLALSHGRLPAASRARLIDACFSEARPAPQQPVEVSIPAGDVELLDGICRRLDHVRTRPAGASCLIDGLNVP